MLIFCWSIFLIRTNYISIFISRIRPPAFWFRSRMICCQQRQIMHQQQQERLKKRKRIKINKLLTRIVQLYLDEFEMWMDKWRIKLAPHKCSQITFTRGIINENERLDIFLNSQLYHRIPRRNF